MGSVIPIVEIRALSARKESNTSKIMEPPKKQSQGVNTGFSDPSAVSPHQTLSFLPLSPRRNFLSVCTRTCSWDLVHVSFLREEVWPPPRGPNVFLIISESHEEIPGEAVARPRCCPGSTEDEETIPAGARGSVSGVHVGMTETGWGRGYSKPECGAQGAVSAMCLYWIWGEGSRGQLSMTLPCKS